jgi:hypothetical protein
MQRLRDAAPTHLQSVAEHFTGRLDAEELAQLGALSAKLVTAPAAGDPPDTACAPVEDC